MVGAYKLDEQQVSQIKTLFENTTLKDREIAIMYNVSREHINRIRTGKRWNPNSRSFVSKIEIEMSKKPVQKEIEKVYISVDRELTLTEILGKLIRKLF
jgi:hypothetical protein